MITQQQLDEQGERVNALAAQLNALRITYGEESSKLVHMIANKSIADMKTAKLASYVVNTKASLQVFPIATEAPKTAPASDLGRVHVDWSGCGHSSGSYRVLADKGKYLEIAFDLDKSHTMTVSKERVKAA